jgi:hypothetical protein
VSWVVDASFEFACGFPARTQEERQSKTRISKIIIIRVKAETVKQQIGWIL